MIKFMLVGDYIKLTPDSECDFEHIRDEAQALDASIAKWTFIVQQLQKGVMLYSDGGSTTCGLCKTFRKYDEERDTITCTSCPVKRVTHEDGCMYTPYEPFADADTRAQQLEYAQQELAFLEALKAKDYEAASKICLPNPDESVPEGEE